MQWTQEAMPRGPSATEPLVDLSFHSQIFVESYIMFAVQGMWILYVGRFLPSAPHLAIQLAKL
ncbi:MAG: hypothetical protein A2503_17730 [Burkholderiales bacterium RIFOXYD12_FULL_59_19]|nr:MAG: hypothetical protein A2503_17730 [Burkholderiales bacterium RIFOXYD12_FULL_59_19]